MTQSTTVTRAGSFRQGRLSAGRPQSLDAWRVTTDDTDVAALVADLLEGGEPRPNEGGGDHAYEVLTSRESVRVLFNGPDAVTARMVLWSSRGLVHDCNGSEFLSPAEKKGQPCGCPPLLGDKKLAARDGRGPTPSIDLAFHLAAAPMLGEFHLMSGSWQLAAQLSDMSTALESVDGPAVCELNLKLVSLTTRSGLNVCYRKPVVKVLGGLDTVAPELRPTTAPMHVPTPAAPNRRPRPAAEPVCSVDVDAVMLHRAAQVLGTGDHHETVIAALSQVAASRQQAAELARLREYVGHIADIAAQALREGDSPGT